MAEIESHERVETRNHVMIKASKNRVHTKAHLQVQDLVQFTDQLRERGAPPDGQVSAVMVEKDGCLIHSLRVDWSSYTINGEPAAQVLSQDQERPSS